MNTEETQTNVEPKLIAAEPEEETTTDEPAKKKEKMSSTNPLVISFKRLSEKAFKPVRGSKLAAGYDLYSAYDCTVPAKGKFLVKTDLQIALPEGSYGRVAPRSGLAVKSFIDVGAGVIDADYRGPVGVLLFNFGDTDFEVKAGDRIAQLICERIFMPEMVEEESLENTERGEGGFGSSGAR